MGARRGEKRENWLLIKGSDEAARSEADPDILEEAPASVISGRTVEDIAAGKPAKKPPTKPRTRRQGRATVPGLHPAGARHPEAEGAARRRLGARDQVRRLPAAGPDPRRQGEAPDPQRPGLDRPLRRGDRGALAALPAKTAILDGEVVVEGAGGASDFSALQADLSPAAPTASATTSSTFSTSTARTCAPSRSLERKERLAALLNGAPEPLRLSEHFDEDGEVMLRHACRLSLEGLVSKQRDAAYPAGRTRSWIKSKCSAARSS